MQLNSTMNPAAVVIIFAAVVLALAFYLVSLSPGEQEEFPKLVGTNLNFDSFLVEAKSIMAIYHHAPLYADVHLVASGLYVIVMPGGTQPDAWQPFDGYLAHGQIRNGKDGKA